MGVKGLTSFIDDNPILLQDFKLHNCKVILDGNNLIHFIYQNYNNSYQYESDYSNYYRKIIQIFRGLKNCNIEAYVIFDGGYEVSDSKLRTTLDRAERRITQASNNCSLLPILANKAFRKALDELDIPHATCSFEADEEIAILANLWNCPVISNDSDFFVYNLKAGFLPLNYVDFRPNESKPNSQYISAQKYHFDHYHYILDNFQPEMIPLIATVLGNDFIKYDTFSSFTQKFNRQKYRLKSASNAVSKITAILNYFDQFKTFEDGRAAITKDFVTSGGVASLQHVIDKSLNSYMKIDSKKSVMADYFNGCCDWSLIVRNDYFNQPLPVWFIQGLMAGKISPIIQNMVILHRIILPCQQEQISQVSSHKPALYIRQVIYGVLFPNNLKKSDHNKSGKKVLRNSHVEEVDRNGKVIGHFYIDPRENIPNFGKLPHLTEVDSLSEKQKKELIINTLGVSENFLMQFDTSDQLLMGVLSYWVANSQISFIQLEALILSIIFLKIKSFCEKKNYKDKTSAFSRKKLSIDDVIKTLKEKEVDKLNVELNSLSENGEIPEKSDRLPIEVLHLYAQYQSCLLFTLLLNELLQSPFEEPVLRNVYDGMTVYYFNKCLVLRLLDGINNEDVLSEMEKHPKLVKLYKSIARAIQNDAKSRPKKMTKQEKKQTMKAVDNLNRFNQIILRLGYVIVLFTALVICYTFIYKTV